MTVNEAYQYAQIRLNRNQSNYGDNIPKYVFVSTFNSAQLMWCEDRFKLDETNITRKDELQQLLKSETLKGIKKKTIMNLIFQKIIFIIKDPYLILLV